MRKAARNASCPCFRSCWARFQPLSLTLSLTHALTDPLNHSFSPLYVGTLYLIISKLTCLTLFHLHPRYTSPLPLHYGLFIPTSIKLYHHRSIADVKTPAPYTCLLGALALQGLPGANAHSEMKSWIADVRPGISPPGLGWRARPRRRPGR